MMSCDLNQLLVHDDLKESERSFQINAKARVEEAAVDDKFNEAFFDGEAQKIGALAVFDKAKDIAKRLVQKKMHYQTRWKLVYLAAQLSHNADAKVKYLQVSAGIGKTWVIIMNAMLLKSIDKKVCIVTKDSALRLQMVKSLQTADDREILVQECNHIDDMYGQELTSIYDEYYDCLT